MATPGGGYDFSPPFAKVTTRISAADLALCHLETPLTSTNTNLSVPGKLVFNTPHQLAPALKKAGYDGCEFASNHTLDQGLAGLADTEQVMADAGLPLAGPSADEARSGEAQVYDVKDASVAHLAYSYTAYNMGGPSTDLPPDAPWIGRSVWPVHGADGIIRDAKQAHDDGADFVVVSMHWGAEYQTAPTQDQRTLARELLGSGAVDLILGTHVHVIQPCEVINGRYVFYGLGNFLSNQGPYPGSGLRVETQEGLMVQVTLSRDEAGALTSTAAYQPTRVRLPGWVIEPVSTTHHPETYRRTSATLQSLGGCELTDMEGVSTPRR